MDSFDFKFYQELSIDKLNLVKSASTAYVIDLYKKLKLKRSVATQHIWFIGECRKAEVTPNFVNIKTKSKTSVAAKVLQAAQKKLVDVGEEQVVFNPRQFNEDILNPFTNSSEYSYTGNYTEFGENYENYNKLDYRTRRKKVRKKVYGKHDKVYEESGDYLYIGYAKNPFGDSFRWNGKTRFSKDSRLNDIDFENTTKWEVNDKKEMLDIRDKRGVTHLYNMVACATGCNPLLYKGYGCYCGFLGSGNITDPIDRCCMLHDICYGNVNCPIFSVYFTPYIWRCWRRRPQCAIDQPGIGGLSICAAGLCECDKQLAKCLARRPCPHRRALCVSSPWRLFQNIILY